MNEEISWYQKPEYTGYRQFLILLGMFGAGFLVALLISGIILLSHYGLKFSEADLKNMPYGIMAWMNIVQDVFLFGLPAMFFAMIVKKRKDFFYFKKSSPVQVWLILILIALACLPVSDLLGQLTQKIPLPKNLYEYFKAKEKTYNDAALAFVNVTSVKYFILSTIMIALLPAVFEELFFRGALQQVMIKWTGNAIGGIIITAIIFSAFHMSYYGFLSRAMLGIVLGLVYYYGKNIWLNILIHFINNTSVLVGLYIMYGNKPLTSDMLEDTSSSTAWYLQLAGVLVLILMLNIFIKKSKQHISNQLS